MELLAYLTRLELIKILKVAKSKNYKAYSVFYLAYILGLRVSEVIGLKLDDVDFSENTITIRRLKGSKLTRNTLTNEMRIVLLYWKRYSKGTFFFDGLNRMWCDRRIKEYGSKAHINRKKLHMHALKHSCAVHMLMGGVDIRTIQKALGHRNINNTMRYLDVSNEKVDRIQSALDELLNVKAE